MAPHMDWIHTIQDTYPGIMLRTAGVNVCVIHQKYVEVFLP